jgi:hypothetical protein
MKTIAGSIPAPALGANAFLSKGRSAGPKLVQNALSHLFNLNDSVFSRLGAGQDVVHS